MQFIIILIILHLFFKEFRAYKREKRRYNREVKPSIDKLNDFIYACGGKKNYPTYEKERKIRRKDMK